MQMYDGGFIGLYRSILNWDWYSDHNTKEVFIHLLLTVNYMPGDWKGRHIEVGQRVTSLSKLSQELGLTIQEIRTSLKHLQSTGEITCETTSQYTVITVNNFISFQKGTHKRTSNSHEPKQSGSKRLTNDQQQYKKGIKEKRKKYISGVAFSPLVGDTLPAIGEGDCSITYAGERHFFPEAWLDEAEEIGWTIEQYVRWKHQDGIYV